MATQDSTIGKRIEIILQEQGLKMYEFGASIGVSKGAVTKWAQDGVKNLRNNHLFAIEDLYGYSARWVALGQGPKKLGFVREEEARQAASVGQRFQTILDELDMKQDQFARSLGIERAELATWVNGKAMPSASQLFAIETRHGYMSRWLALGDGAKTVQETQDITAQYVIAAKIKAHELMDISKIPTDARRALDQTRHAFEHAGNTHEEMTA